MLSLLVVAAVDACVYCIIIIGIRLLVRSVTLGSSVVVSRNASVMASRINIGLLAVDIRLRFM